MLLSGDSYYLALALEGAQAARRRGEVPVGAVVVKDGQVIGRGGNSPVATCDPTGHAEINAIREAALATGNYRLEGCTLYVTLEPCAMCVGAMLHARLARVVYGVPQPKSGAAGSVVDLFSSAINHQTAVQSAAELGPQCEAVARASRQLLQDFFAEKRVGAQVRSQPLRQDALRTPEACCANLPGYPFAPRYLSDLPALNGLRMHYLDEGPPDAVLTYLCLHGNPAWSYLYRKMIPVWVQSGARVIAPDMIGFGRSDKPKKDTFHSFTWHRQCLLEFIERLDLRDMVLVVQGWGGMLGLTLPMANPERYRGLLVMNTTLACGDAPLSDGFKAWRQICKSKPDLDIARLLGRGNPHLSPDEWAAYIAPFPDSGYRAATRAFPFMVPDHAGDEGAAVSRWAREFWRDRWHGQTMMAIGMQDPVFGEGVMRELAANIRGCPEPLRLAHAGHFVQEHGQEIARAAVAVFSPEL